MGRTFSQVTGHCWCGKNCFGPWIQALLVYD